LGVGPDPILYHKVLNMFFRNYPSTGGKPSGTSGSASQIGALKINEELKIINIAIPNVMKRKIGFILFILN
jgi:hypothetical protein